MHGGLDICRRCVAKRRLCDTPSVGISRVINIIPRSNQTATGRMARNDRLSRAPSPSGGPARPRSSFGPHPASSRRAILLFTWTRSTRHGAKPRVGPRYQEDGEDRGRAGRRAGYGRCKGDSRALRPQPGLGTSQGLIRPAERGDGERRSITPTRSDAIATNLELNGRRPPTDEALAPPPPPAKVHTHRSV